MALVAEASGMGETVEAATTAVGAANGDGGGTKKQQSTTGAEMLVGFPPLCRPLQFCLHYVNKNVQCKKDTTMWHGGGGDGGVGR